MNQEQMYRRAEKRSANINKMFLEFVKDGLTAKELEYLIKRNPSVWKRFENWIDKLP